MSQHRGDFLGLVICNKSPIQDHNLARVLCRVLHFIRYPASSLASACPAFNALSSIVFRMHCSFQHAPNQIIPMQRRMSCPASIVLSDVSAYFQRPRYCSASTILSNSLCSILLYPASSVWSSILYSVLTKVRSNIHCPFQGPASYPLRLFCPLLHPAFSPSPAFCPASTNTL